MSENDVVIKVENLGKQYIIGHQNDRERYHSLRDTIAQTCKNLIRTTKDILTGKPVIQGDTTEEVWALKDVNFEVKRGESLGIIGRNGAGKSTLLKILSRITEPTTGKVTIKGRVASLLEVGTGFHPELSGRENIFLNGAILGMTYKEIKSKFDEIVAFAEVEKYLDTPVKRYSSGMYVRLAFAVAAHLEPDILVVDEVLAVGDSFFQKKCIDKMLEITNLEKTVIFVSHNISALRSLCKSALIVDKGAIVNSGNIEKMIEYYLKQNTRSGKKINLSEINRCNVYPEELIFEKITFCSHPLHFGNPIEFLIKLKTQKASESKRDLELAISIKDSHQNCLIHVGNRYIDQIATHETDEAEYHFKIENNLRPGIYYMNFFLRTKDTIQDWLSNAASFVIEDGNPYSYPYTEQLQGLILPKFSFSVRQIQNV